MIAYKASFQLSLKGLCHESEQRLGLVCAFITMLEFGYQLLNFLPVTVNSLCLLASPLVS